MSYFISFFRPKINDQGCQMVCFQTKNPNLGKFWRALEWKMQVYFVVIWNILRAFGNLWPFGNCVMNNLATLLMTWTDLRPPSFVL
jgi:hypothetical protein